MTTSSLRMLGRLVVGACVAASLAACTAITNNRIDQVINCQGAVDGTVCGNQYTDHIDRICVGGACVERKCGDGFVDAESGEVCDDGNDVAGDGCEPQTCQYTCVADADCGDGLVCSGTETCDVVHHICQAGTPVVCTPSDACHSSTCQEPDGTCLEALVDDADGDGHVSKALHPSCGDDCNDSNAEAYPGHAEVCGDGVDNDCNMSIDETQTTWYADCDKDTYALSGAKVVTACLKPATTAVSTGCSNDNGDWTWRNPNSSLTRDCADNTALAHPDDPAITSDDVQFQGTTIPGTSSYDWNCNGTWEQQRTDTTLFCLVICKPPCPVCDTSVSCCSPLRSAWRDTPVPSCGSYGYREWCGDESTNANCSADTWEQQLCR